MNNEEWQQIERMMKKAHRSLKSAQNLFEDGDYDFASSRAYYGVFYAMEAYYFYAVKLLLPTAVQLRSLVRSMCKQGFFHPKQDVVSVVFFVNVSTTIMNFPRNLVL